MTEHEIVRELLALAVADALDATEQSRVQQHLRECNVCREELETWKLYTSGLQKMPQPATPFRLAERTQSRVLRERETRTEAQRNALVLGALALFGWSSSLALWLLLRVYTGGTMVVVRTNILRPDLWAGFWTVLVWASGATAAIVLAKCRREWRAAL